MRSVYKRPGYITEVLQHCGLQFCFSLWPTIPSRNGILQVSPMALGGCVGQAAGNSVIGDVGLARLGLGRVEES